MVMWRVMSGTVVVDTANHFLYFVLNGGQAIRYGVGIGRQGFEWAGRGVIRWKQRWPRWFPPNEMIDRQPELEKYRARQVSGTNIWEGGMEPGVTNPLGARALYIYQDGKDTLFRLHGSPEWWSIGKSVSSGCVRLIHQDIIDRWLSEAACRRSSSKKSLIRSEMAGLWKPNANLVPSPPHFASTVFSG